MRLSAVEKIAKSKGIKNTWKFTKPELIKTIQETEGNTSCFASINRKNCAEINCCWRSDCLR